MSLRQPSAEQDAGRYCPLVTTYRTGVWQALSAYSIWGLFPLYWTLFHGIAALEVLAHRIVWSFVAVAVILAAIDRVRVGALLSLPWRIVALYGAAASLIVSKLRAPSGR